MCLDRRKNHGCGQKKPEGTSSAMFGIGTAAKCNSSDLPTEFAGGDHLSVPCAVPMMSALPNDWFRFSFCYSYGSQLFGLESVSASQQNTTKMKSSKAKATMVMRFPAKKNAGCPKAPRDFPPRKDGILPPPPPLGCLGTPPLPTRFCEYGRAHANVPDFLSHGAPLRVLCAWKLRYNTTDLTVDPRHA